MPQMDNNVHTGRCKGTQQSQSFFHWLHGAQIQSCALKYLRGYGKFSISLLFQQAFFYGTSMHLNTYVQIAKTDIDIIN